MTTESGNLDAQTIQKLSSPPSKVYWENLNLLPSTNIRFSFRILDGILVSRVSKFVYLDFRYFDFPK